MPLVEFMIGHLSHNWRCSHGNEVGGRQVFAKNNSHLVVVRLTGGWND
jgi:hypothetical protein